jgi:PII-like signaling protein
MVIEIVDSEAKINEFLPALDPMIGGDLVPLEMVSVIHCRRAAGAAPSSGV